MRVLQINKLYYPHIGGVEITVRELARRLSQWAEVRVLVANEAPRTLVEQVDGIEVTRVASLGRLRSAPLAPGFVTWLARLKSDVYHLHFPSPPAELAYALVRPKGKLVVTYHSGVVRQKILGQLYRPAIQAILERADRIVASSPNLIANSAGLAGFRDKCVVISPGVDPAALALSPEGQARVEALKREHGDRIVFFLGRLIYYKGAEYLIRAMQQVEGKLLIAGSGPLRERLGLLASELGVLEKVVFLGTLGEAELPPYYHACNVFVLPSVAPSEAFGLVQIEAHCCGTPVVSTDLPTGVPFANLDGETGLVVPPRDPGALAMAINRLLDDEALCLRLGATARTRAEQEFTWDRMAERTFALYEEILGD